MLSADNKQKVIANVTQKALNADWGDMYTPEYRKELVKAAAETLFDHLDKSVETNCKPEDELPVEAQRISSV